MAQVHLAPKAALPILQGILECSMLQHTQTGTIDSSMDAEETVQQMFADPSCRVFRYPRVITIAETRVPLLEDKVDVIKVPPLRVRPGDIADLARYYLLNTARQRGLPKLSITSEARKRTHLQCAAPIHLIRC